MYTINQDPAQVIPDISEDFIMSKFIILIASYNYTNSSPDRWIAILDLSNRVERIVSWFGSNIRLLNESDLTEWETGQVYDPYDSRYGNFYRSTLIDIITQTWNQLNDYDKTIYICDGIIEVEQLLRSNNISASLQKAILDICHLRSFTC